jgi:hypothetical protein
VKDRGKAFRVTEGQVVTLDLSLTALIYFLAADNEHFDPPPSLDTAGGPPVF